MRTQRLKEAKLLPVSGEQDTDPETGCQVPSFKHWITLASLALV